MSTQEPSTFPFSKLPTELKTEVFMHDALIVNRSHQNRQRLRTRAMALSFVCREWRDIVLAMPVLWSSIYVDYTHNYRYQKMYFDFYVKTSKNHPLDVYICFYDDDVYSIFEASVVSGDLIDEAYRLRDLNISFGPFNGDSQEYMDHIESNIYGLVTSRMPLLETAYISCDYPDSKNELDVDLGGMFCDSPKLRDLTISLLNLDSSAVSSCTQVTTLKLQWVSIELWIESISYMPSLTHVTLDSYRKVVEYARVPERFRFEDGTSVFVHNSLVSLELISAGAKDEEDGIMLFLRSIQCPSLIKLHICNDDSRQFQRLDEDRIIGAAATFLRASNCPLKDFKVEVNGFDGRNFWPLLDCIHTKVETLHLTSRFPSSDIIPDLIQMLSSLWYLPQIVELHVREHSSPLDYSTMYGLLRHRLDSWPSGTAIRPSLLKIVLRNDTVLDAGLEETTDAEIVDGIRDLQERGMKVSLTVGPKTFMGA